MRLPGLSRSLWYDELFTVFRFAASPLTAFGRQAAANNHPLASLLAWAAEQALPSGEAWLRAPFALLGALAAPALAWSGARAGAPRAGLLGGALLALSPGAVLLSQQVRGYAGLMLAGALLPGLLARALGRRPEEPALPTLVALVLTAGLGLASHLSLALPLAVWTALVVAAPRLRLAALPGQGTALVGLAGGGALGLLLLAPTLGRTVRWAADALDGGDPGAGGLALGPHQLLALVGGEGLAGRALALALLGLCASGLISLLVPARGASPARVAPRRLGLLLAGPLLGGLGLMLLRAPAYPRFLTLALPALLLGAGAGLSALAPRGRAAALLALLAALAAAPLGAQAGRELQDLRRGATLARHLVGPGAPIVGGGFVGSLLVVYDPERRVLDEPGPERPERPGFEALLRGAAPLAWIDPFPGLTPPERRAELRRLLGEPLVLPGSESPVLVYARR